MRRFYLTLGLLAAARLAQAQFSFTPTPVAVVGFDSGASFRSIVAADFNGDGRDDAATLTWCGARCDNYGSIFLTQPGGSLQGAMRFLVGLNPICVLALDVNDDGKPDLLTFSADSGTAGVYLNQGNGVFPPFSNYLLNLSAGGSYAQPQLADFDGDGRLDLLMTTSAGALIKLNKGGTTGWVDASSSPAAPSTNFPLLVADFNQDGRPDLLTFSGYGNVTRSATVRLNNGQGTAFTTPSASPTFTLTTASPIYYTRTVAADVDHDGKVDIITGTTAGPQLYRNLGGGVFSGPTSLGISSDLTPSQLADLDGDGLPELLVVLSPGLALGIYHNIGNGQFEPYPSQVTQADMAGFSLGDADGDGRRDLFFGVSRSSATVQLNATTPLAASPATPTAAWTLAPNPAHEAVQLRGLPAGPVAVQVYDAQGRLVRQAATATVPTTGLAPGLYLLRATAGNTTGTRRLVVE